MLTVIDKSTIGSAISAPSSMSDKEKDKLRNFAKLVKARQDAQKQLDKIQEMIELVGERDMTKNLWISQAGDVLPLFDIEDSHLKNIYTWLINHGREVNKNIKKEYIARFGELPGSSDVIDKNATATSSGSKRRYSAFNDTDEF